MSTLERKYYARMFNGGTYLGLLPYTINDFSYRQDINTGSTEATIVVEGSIDISNQQVSIITNEVDNPITDESGFSFTTERAADVVGTPGSGIMIANNNGVDVYEISDSNPNGVLVFSGSIYTWTPSITDSKETISITAISNGKDLADYIYGTNTYTLQISQLTGGNTFYANPVPGSFNIAVETITPGSNYSLSKILINACAGDGTPHVVSNVNLRCDVYSGTPNGSKALLGSATINITNQYPTMADVIFVFPTSIPLISGGAYFFAIVPDNYAVATITPGFTHPYAGGNLWTVSSDYSVAINNDTQNMYFQVYSSTSVVSTATFTAYDPAQMVRDAVDNYRGQGGSVGYSAPTIVNTGQSINYTFITANILEIIQKALDLAPFDWFFYVDPATQVLYFKETATTATHKFILGRHINNLELEASIENIVNTVYFTGGPTAAVNLLTKYTNQTSIAIYGIRMKRISDNRVTDTATAAALANSVLNENAAEIYMGTVEISAEAYDISTIKLGDVIAIEGFGNFVDRLLLQITSLRRMPDSVIITIGELPVRDSTYIEQIKSDLVDLQTLQNPTTPS